MTELPPQTDTTPIAFRSAEEFQSRPNYLAELQCASDALDRIVGKYEFPKDQQLQCGLNGCNHWHQHGYVIRTKDGRETHCGQHCGRREFGVSFEEVEAMYLAAEERKSVEDFLKQISEDRAARIAETQLLRSSAISASSHLNQIVGEIQREPALYRMFSSCLRVAGRIQVADEESRRLRAAMGAAADKADLKVIGVIRGGNAIEAAGRAVQELQYLVLVPLEDLADDKLKGLTMRELTEKSRVLGQTTQVISRARQALEDYRVFTSPANLQTLALLRETLSKKDRTNRTTKILERVAHMSEQR